MTGVEVIDPRYINTKEEKFKLLRNRPKLLHPCEQTTFHS